MSGSVGWPTLHDDAVGASSLLPGVASLVLPPKGATGVQSIVPGFIPQAYNMLSGLKHLSGMIMQPLTGVQATGLPGADTTEEMARGSMDAANDLIPHMTPDTPTAGMMADVGHAVGQMAPFGGGKAALDLLPGAAKTAAEWMMPGLASKWAAPVSAGLVGGMDAATNSSETAGNLPPDPYAPLPPLPALPTKAKAFDPLPADPYAPLPAVDDQPTDGLPWGKIAMYGGAALAVIAGGKTALELADKALGNLRDAAYNGNTADFNAAQAAKATGMSPPHVEAPLPVGAGTFADNVKAGYSDSNARLNAFTDIAAANPSDASKWRAFTGLVNNSAAFNGRIAETATTGVDKASGVIMPSLVDHWNNVAAFTADQTKLFNEARYAANELDNRGKLYNQALGRLNAYSPPGAMDDVNFRVNFPDLDSGALRQAVTDARADPVVSNELDTINAVHRSLLDVGFNQDYFSAADRAQLLRDHPNYLASVNTDGSITGPFGARGVPLGGGLDSIPIHASEIDKQHFTDLMRTIERNTWTRNYVDLGNAYQQANPSAAKIFQPFKSQSTGAFVDGPEPKGDWLSVRRNGVTENWKVYNTDLLRDMQGGHQVMGPVQEGLNYMKSIFQSATTGPIAALTGHFFPAVNALRATLLGSVFRPANTAFGPISSLVSNVTGGRINPRGMLPDAALGTLSGMIQNMGAEGARGVAAALDRTATSPANRMLRAIFGDNAVDGMSTRAQAQWDTSIRAEMKANGSLGSNGYATTELPANQLGARNQMSSPLNNLVPDLFRVTDPTLLGHTVPVGGAMPTIVKMSNLYHDMQSIVNDAAQTHFYSTNKARFAAAGRTQNELAYETRQLTGDPGTHGSNKTLQSITSVVPYSNIIIQDLARMGRSFGETPISTAYGLISALGSLALGSIYTAKLAGPDAVNHLTNELSDDQKAARVQFYIPGVKPENSPFIDLPQRVRMFYPLMLQAMHDALQVQSHADNPTISGQAMDWLHDYFNKHVTSSTMNSSLAGLSSAISPPLPPAVEGIANLLGTNANPTIYNQTMPGETGRMPIGGDIRAPGHLRGSDPLTGTVSGEQVGHAVAAMTGVAGSSIMQALNTIAAGQRTGKDPIETLGLLKDQWVDRLQNSVPFMKGTVFSNQSALTTKTPLIAHTEAALDAMRPTQTWKSDQKYGPTDTSNGYTRAKGLELQQPSINGNVVPKDPTMARLYDTYGAYTSIIEKKLMPQVSDIRKQMNNIQNSAQPIDTIRTQTNALERQLQTKYEGIAVVVNDADHAASQIIGKPVSILKLDWSKGPEQFNIR